MVNDDVRPLNRPMTRLALQRLANEVSWWICHLPRSIVDLQRQQWRRLCHGAFRACTARARRPSVGGSLYIIVFQTLSALTPYIIGTFSWDPGISCVCSQWLVSVHVAGFLGLSWSSHHVRQTEYFDLALAPFFFSAK